ncbi:hypothetical protein EYF80_019301 [Liparis tanakae]|uniref:Uncharacterized protein n=1 Tax=Liparis tanakae TaxID=230148 RepID=A0A4Z2HZI5_9TELE|nr:hypothetical protein EYF80_019301 [Liparis tanakae]
MPVWRVRTQRSSVCVQVARRKNKEDGAVAGSEEICCNVIHNPALADDIQQPKEAAATEPATCCQQQVGALKPRPRGSTEKGLCLISRTRKVCSICIDSQLYLGNSKCCVGKMTQRRLCEKEKKGSKKDEKKIRGHIENTGIVEVTSPITVIQHTSNQKPFSPYSSHSDFHHQLNSSSPISSDRGSICYHWTTSLLIRSGVNTPWAKAFDKWSYAAAPRYGAVSAGCDGDAADSNDGDCVDADDK